MKFSVLINNYNYARFLPEALDSVFAQTHPPHEIIVVDDGSTDDSLAVLESLRAAHPRLRVHAQPNGGQLSAMRAGISLATGDWCAFLDADDTWTPEHLAKAADALQTHPEASAYYSGHRETEGPPLYRSKWPAGAAGPFAGLVSVTGVRIGTITSTILLRRDTARLAVDLPPELNRDWRVRADDVLLYGASFSGAVFVHEPAMTVNYRIHGSNAFANQQDDERERIYLVHKQRLFAIYRERFGLRPGEELERLRKELLEVPRNLASPEARRRYRRAIRRVDAPLLDRARTFIGSYL
jgi:Glycosyltransferases involved in cell wall biogenesis